ncbi:MAG: general secretion pathway protein GspK, partial [Planctomycetales bacterium]|nr:general secretion pathway protein GspK [Planctomycetales bacterium]
MAPVGSVLLMVLVVVAILTLCVTASLKTSQSHYHAASQVGRRLQTQRFAESGAEFVKAYLMQTDADISLDGGIQDNPARFQGQLLIDGVDLVDRGRCSIVAPAVVNGVASGVRFGLENESTRIHLNALASDPNEATPRNRLMTLPGMTEEIADAILDWIDADAIPREFGAELDHYQSLSPPLTPRNGPIGSIDELLMVRGVTPELLFGLDRNRNYLVDAFETPQGDLLDADNSTGVFNRGWAALLTIHSAERFVNPDGEPRINVNGDSLQELHDQLAPLLGEDQANFIVLYRQFGPQGGGAASGAAGANGGANAPNGSNPGGASSATGAST